MSCFSLEMFVSHLPSLEDSLFATFWPAVTNLSVKTESVESPQQLARAEMREAKLGPGSAPDASCKLGQYLSPCILFQNDYNIIYAFPKTVGEISLLSSDVS